MIKFLLCDDSKRDLNKIERMLESIFIMHDLEANVEFKATSDIELLSYIKDHQIDVFVLDINLNCELNGIDIANIIRQQNKNCYIIFATNHCEYNELAYKCKTFDYLRKPLSKTILEETILRLFDDLKGHTLNKKYILINNKNTLIAENDVYYIKRDGMKLIFHTNTENIETYSSFNKLQNELPNNFVRCHKSFIANINNISKLECSSNVIYFRDNSNCDIGPKYKADFIKEVKYYG